MASKETDQTAEFCGQVCVNLVKEGTDKVQLKEMVTSALVESLTPIRTEMERLEKDPGINNAVALLHDSQKNL